MQDGVIFAVGDSLDKDFLRGVKADPIKLDLQGRIVTPAIVDMHSHAGLHNYDGFWASDDTNEMTNPVFSQVSFLLRSFLILLNSFEGSSCRCLRSQRSWHSFGESID